MPLWSFEGGRIVRPGFTIFGGHSGGGTPLPIPNREVKPASADGTRRATSRESRSPPNYLKGPERGPSCCGGERGAAFGAAPLLRTVSVGVDGAVPDERAVDVDVVEDDCAELIRSAAGILALVHYDLD